MDVAVVIATYNQSNYLAEAIDSVLDQTLQPSQIILTDDGSTDGTQDIIREYASRNPETIETALSDQNQGIPQNFNDGIRRVTADAVTFLAGDDRYHPDKIKQEAAKLDLQPQAEVVYSNFAFIDEAGGELERWAESPPPNGDALEECLTRAWPNGALFRNPMVSMDVLDRVGLFDESFAIYEDWELKIRLSAATELAFCDEVLTEYRRHPGGISSRSRGELRARMVERILDKHTETIAQLDKRERRNVERILGGRLHKHRAFAALESKDWKTALGEYSLAIRTDPRRIKHYRSHLRLLLPEATFERLVRPNI